MDSVLGIVFCAENVRLFVELAFMFYWYKGLSREIKKRGQRKG